MLLEMRDIVKNFGPVCAVQNVDLDERAWLSAPTVPLTLHYGI